MYNTLVVDQLSSLFAALSDPTRRKVIDRLSRGPANINELAAPFRISQQAISRHVRYLQEARLVSKRREGRNQICTLRPGVIAEVADWAEKYRKFWKNATGDSMRFWKK